MADQCIVCLENLDVESPAAAAAVAAAAAPPKGTVQSAPNSDGSVPPQAVAATTAASVVSIAIVTNHANGCTSPKQLENHNNVAQIQVCGHVLHDSCLREWSEKANSCPICRQTFNVVHVYDKLGGAS